MAHVRVLLRQSVQKLGKAGELVQVKPGYARNHLLPKGLAMMATESNMRRLEHERRLLTEKLAKQVNEFNRQRRELEKLKLRIKMQAGEGGKLFGSVTSANLAALLVENGFDVDRRKVELAENIKTIGPYSAEIKLHPEVTARLRFTVVPAEDKSAEQKAAEEFEAAEKAEAAAAEKAEAAAAAAMAADESADAESDEAEADENDEAEADESEADESEADESEADESETKAAEEQTP